MTLAKTQEKLNKIGSSYEGVGDKMSAFDRMEEKANRMLDEANAMAELNQKEEDTSVEALMNKYEEDDSGKSLVEDELEAMKRELGL